MNQIQQKEQRTQEEIDNNTRELYGQDVIITGGGVNTLKNDQDIIKIDTNLITSSLAITIKSLLNKISEFNMNKIANLYVDLFKDHAPSDIIDLTIYNLYTLCQSIQANIRNSSLFVSIICLIAAIYKYINQSITAKLVEYFILKLESLLVTLEQQQALKEEQQALKEQQALYEQQAVEQTAEEESEESEESEAEASDTKS